MFSEPAENPAPKSGIFYPEDLAVLQALFNRACWMNKTLRGSEEANRIALRLMLAYRAGVRDRDLLTQIAAVGQSPGQQSRTAA
jgi:hypothetical protein